MGTRRRELISGDLSSVGSTVLAQIEIDLRIVASGRGEFLKVYSFQVKQINAVTYCCALPSRRFQESFQ